MKPYFVKHEPCPSCGSRDNLARYSDGAAFCFGCRYIERPDSRKFDPNVVEFEKENTPLPDDLSCHFHEDNLNWLRKYLNDDEIIKHFRYSPSRKRHVLTIGSFWEERSVNKGPRKSICHGTKPFNIFGKMTDEVPVVFVVEDAVSAIKLSRVAAALCLFGSMMPSSWQVWLAKSDAKKVIYWLDYDKMEVGQMLAMRHNNLMPGQATTMTTIKDPKDVDTEVVRNIIQQYCKEKV